jgi:hypothetical protein
MMQMQMAAPVGRGATDVSFATGVMYGAQTDPRFIEDDGSGNEIKTERQSTAFTLPGVEGNLQYGFNENVAFNLHGSAGGLQPGLKITVNDAKDDAHFALLPQIAFGYGSGTSQTNTYSVDGLKQAGYPSISNAFTFLGGLRLMVSHKSGFYAGVAYDFTYNRQFNKVTVKANDGTDNTFDTDTIYQTVAHNIGINLGFDVKVGWFHIRPEIAVAITPGIGQTRTVATPDISNDSRGTGGFGWAIFPGFSFGVTTPRRELTRDEEEAEAEKKKAEEQRLRRMRNQRRGIQNDDDSDRHDGDPDDDDDLDEKPKKKRGAFDDDDN